MRNEVLALLIALCFAALVEYAGYKLGNPQSVWFWNLILGVK